MASADPNVIALTGSASRWMREALEGWANNDYEAIAMLAPMAVEHLGKAALWHRHPSLLVPLAPNAEESLHILTDKPELANPRLRTIGLKLVLDRLGRCLVDFPLSRDRRQNLVDTRNGSVHAGLPTESLQVLTDALAVCGSLLADLSLSDTDFYGDQKWNVSGILSKQRSDVEATVAAKMARARNHLSQLEQRLGPEVFEETCIALEAQAPSVVDDYGLTRDQIVMNRVCPECGSRGRLHGRLDADPEVEWDVDPDGQGGYTPVYAGATWTLFLFPQGFACNVCQLGLAGPAELNAGDLPASRVQIEEDQLDDDFDLNDFIRANYYDD